MNAGGNIRAYLSICRISNLPSVWTNTLCAYLLATGTFSWRGYLIPAFALSCFYLAGMCLNDFCDRAHDVEHRPFRPIPSGSILPREALLLAIALTASGCAAILTAPCKEGLIAALILISIIVWYDFDHKRNPYSVLLMASCRLLIFVVTPLSVAGTVSETALLAGAAQFSYVVCLSLVARYEGSRSTPFTLPVIPLMLAGISLLDGIILAILVAPGWLAAGLGGAILMQGGQKYVRGD